MSKRKFTGNISGKGYYIALILCAVAIGITGYLYYRNADDVQLERPTTPTSTADTQGGLQAVATQPGGNATANEEQPTVQKTISTVQPVSGQTVAGYAMDCLSYNVTTRDWRVHNGIDITAEAGTPVVAAAAGTVYTVYEDETMGHTVVIRHEDGYTTRYASLDAEVTVAPGQAVAMGEKIGTVGSSALLETALGDHVHFSVSLNDKDMDPAQFLPAA